MTETILILDFGSQYTQLIARRVRELNVYCEIQPYYNFNKPIEGLRGVILSGSPHSVRDNDAPKIDFSLFRNKVPILGVCYGSQLLAQTYGGNVEASNTREYGRANLSKINQNNILFKDIDKDSQVWMSHGDTITQLPNNAENIASTETVENAAFCFSNESTYGIQFHPEVYHSTQGIMIIKNFLTHICHCKQNWTSDSFIESTVAELKKQLGNDKVVLGLSGGVDSSVCAVLLHKAIGNNLNCVFVDNGLLRKNEFENVLHSYRDMGLRVIGVRAADKFYAALKDISDPELKRKAIGKTFIEVFDEEAHKINEVKWLAQGTIYPDVIESVSVKGPSATIKSHHNVGGLPDFMKLKIVEPLRSLFKDEVRRVGKALQMSPQLLERHPFPGPGLAIRILGDITPQKVQLLQEADDIFINLLKQYDLYKTVWQAGVIFLPVQSVGVMGDERTYENAVALRAVSSTDGMTADWCHLPYDFLAKVSNEIINNVKGINRVVYDISSKPPATIEWE
ncbi:MAG: glutamine-hydrolyzing GMP synthase [Bacteroidia bacterium]|nr:glutamine-hydrolyzing GMP synthase [Bacteroidia bacterium]MCZ2248411.1 glutamine-hydrolyzing GMP synthase [Bacteroidia bacterium]